MPETRKLDRDRVVAAAIVVAVHVVLGWGLARLPTVNSPAADAGQALQLYWVAAPPRYPAATQPDRAPAGQPLRTGPSRSRVPSAAVARVGAPNSAAAVEPPLARNLTGPGTLSAVFVEQAGQWARQQTPMTFERADPLTRRGADLPGTPNRLQLAKRLTPADAVAVVGSWFAGPGYTADPCPELRKDVNDLSQAGDSAALQDALYYEKRACW